MRKIPLGLGLLSVVLTVGSLSSCSKDYSSNEWIGRKTDYYLSYDQGVHFVFKSDGTGDYYDHRKAPKYYSIEFELSGNSITIGCDGQKWGTGSFSVGTWASDPNQKYRVLTWMGENFSGPLMYD